MLDEMSFGRYCEAVKTYLHSEWPDVAGHIFNDSHAIESMLRRQLMVQVMLGGFMGAANVPDCAATVAAKCSDSRLA